MSKRKIKEDKKINDARENLLKIQKKIKPFLQRRYIISMPYAGRWVDENTFRSARSEYNKENIDN